MGLNKTAFIILLVLAIFLVSGQQGCPGKQEAADLTINQSLEDAQEAPKAPIAIMITSAPAVSEPGVEVTLSWKIESELNRTVTHTAIHYDTESHPGNFSTDVTPDASRYPELTKEFASGIFDVPSEFNVTIKPREAGKIFYRAHAIFEGKNYWTEEKVLVVSLSKEANIKELLIEADDSGFYINDEEVTFIKLNRGDDARITFQIRSQGVYFGGLDFRGCGQQAVAGKPGESVKMNFMAEETCRITSYWPSSGVKKADLDVLVE